ncbi:hypothetical protein Cgig2_025490 [Carnegiea gigantea]|uniref:Uncharacterized protein n=1 Tax=Carnegiea gigantea TaxID=171969 RepID=A0A9Q1K816_9CARY|nr:hypothetical protein Cgig2_025490 [Carnegiea gigantea]
MFANVGAVGGKFGGRAIVGLLVLFGGISGCHFFIKLKVIVASGKKSANWTNRDDKKLLDILIEQRAQGSVKFEWSLVKVILKNEGINKEGTQIKNRKTGVCVDYKTGAMVVSDLPGKTFFSPSKRKSEGGTSSYGKRQELLDWSSRDKEVHQALTILRIREETKQRPFLTK